MASRRHSRLSKQAPLTPEERRKLQDDWTRSWQKRIKAAEAALEDNRIHERYAFFEREKVGTLETLIQSKDEDEKAYYANYPTSDQRLIALLKCAQYYDTPKGCRPETERYLESLRELKYKSPSPNVSDERYTAIRIAGKKARIESDEYPDRGATYQDVEEWMRELYPGIPDRDISATLAYAGALNEPEISEFGGPLVRWSNPDGRGELFLTDRGRRFLERQLKSVVKAEPPAKDSGNRGSWQEVRARLETKRVQGGKWPGYQAVAEELLCSTSTAYRAVKESPKLRGWVKQSSQQTMTAEPFNEVVADRTPQHREPPPDEMLSDEVMGAKLAKLIDEVTPEERARIHAMPQKDLRRLLSECQSQDKDPEPSPLDDCPDGIPGFRVKHHKRT